MYASLNWASLVGISLILWAIPAGIVGGIQIYFVLQRRADTTPAVIAKTVVLVFQSIGRILALPYVGLMLFLNGWRLDPILQFCVLLLALGIFFESATSIANDYQKWRFRTGRAKASIEVTSQPSDTPVR